MSAFAVSHIAKVRDFIFLIKWEDMQPSLDGMEIKTANLQISSSLSAEQGSSQGLFIYIKLFFFFFLKFPHCSLCLVSNQLLLPHIHDSETPFIDCMKWLWLGLKGFMSNAGSLKTQHAEKALCNSVLDYPMVYCHFPHNMCFACFGGFMINLEPWGLFGLFIYSFWTVKR